MRKLALTLTLIALPALARPTRVAFLELPGPDGRRMELEPGNRFAHTALAYNGRWLEADPWAGVTLVPFATLQKMALSITILEHPEGPEVDPARVREWMHRPFDPDYTWDNDKLYCTELIAKLLGVAPHPMRFDAPHWPPAWRARAGQPGISPDLLYTDLLKMGFRLTNE